MSNGIDFRKLALGLRGELTTAQSQLAAWREDNNSLAERFEQVSAERDSLREELARYQSGYESLYDRMNASEQRLAAAERRNSDLLLTLRSALQGVEMVGLQDHRIDYTLAANIKAEIESALGRKPTESGASE